MFRSGEIAVLVALATSVSSSAFADKKTSKALYQRGLTSYNVGEFEAAISAFTAAYHEHPAPAYLFNIAQCHRKLQNCDRAVFFYERFLDEKPEAANAREVVRWIEELRTACVEDAKGGPLDEGSDDEATSAGAQRTESPPGDAPKAATPSPGATTDRPAGSDVTTNSTDDAPPELAINLPPPTLDGASAHPVTAAPPPDLTVTTQPPAPSRWPWLVVGVGVAAAATGGVLIAMHQPRVVDGALQPEFRDTQTIGTVTLASGAAVAVLGAVLLLVVD